MMRYKINDNHGIEELISSGSMKTTLTEVTMLISGLYCAMAKSDELAAEVE